MSEDTPCPCCDVENMTPFQAMAIGVALGAAFGDIHAITERCCTKHRMQWTLSMLSATVEQQRQSFAYGNTSLDNPDVTREMVDRAAEDIDRSK